METEINQVVCYRFSVLFYINAKVDCVFYLSDLLSYIHNFNDSNNRPYHVTPTLKIEYRILK